MLTFRRISFVLSILVLPFVGFGQGLSVNISSPGPFFAGQSFTVSYEVTFNDPNPFNFTLVDITLNCPVCTETSALVVENGGPLFNGNMLSGTYEFTIDPSFGNNFGFVECEADPQNPSYSTQLGYVNFFALPVDLISFALEAKNNKVELSWQTATELNNEAFMVEKSTDGSKFSTIGKVNGAGTTFETQNYTFVDENPGKGIAYYRLKQMDFDGTYEYSDVVSVVLDGRDDEAVVYPNPVSGMATLRFAEEPTSAVLVKVYNAVGVEVSRYEVDALDGTELSFDVSTLPVGTYFVKVEKDNTTSTTVLKKL